MIYWTANDQKNIELYIQTTDLNEKNRIFGQLYNSIKINAEQVYFNYNSTIDQDEVQNLILFIFEKVLPKINPDKVQATQQLIWISLNRKTINNYNSKKNNPFEYISDLTMFETFSTPTTTNEYKTNIEHQEERKEKQDQILKEIETRIIQQEVVNKTNSIFLILLKEYLIENDFDATGFREYVMERMSITRRKFWGICSVLGIRSKIMNEDNIKPN